MNQIHEHPRDDTTESSTTGQTRIPHRKAILFASRLWLGRAERYFAMLSQRTAGGQRRATQRYPIADLGSLNISHVEAFSVSSTLEAKTPQVGVSYRCLGEVQLLQSPRTLDGYFGLTEIFSRHGVSHSGMVRGGVARIDFNPEIPVELIFRANLREAAITAWFRNLGTLGESVYKFSPHHLSLDLLRAIEGMILGERNRFNELSAAVVPRRERVALCQEVWEASGRQSRTVPTQDRHSWVDRLKRGFGR